MDAAIDVRPLQIPADCAAIARISSSCFPEWPVSMDQVVGREARRSPERMHRAWIACDGATAVAYGYIEEPAVAARPGRIRIRVLVDPARRGEGLGAALYETLLHAARESGATELVTEAQASDARAPRFLTDRGFHEYHRRVECRLPLARVDTDAIGRGIDACTDAWFRSGVRVASYRQLLDSCEDAPRRLYVLDSTLFADVPFGLSGSFPSFEHYCASELADPGFMPDATFVALDRNRWIGLCALMNGAGCLLTSVTGVLREWRRRGLARWLKLHSIRYALENGCPELRAFNDEINQAIVGLNDSLGFRTSAIELRFRRALQ